MKPYKVSISEQELSRISERLADTQARQLRTKNHITEQSNHLKHLEDTNPEYTEQLHDRRMSIHSYWLVALVMLTAGIDLLLALNGMTILTEKLSIAAYWRYAIPLFITLVEIGVSYTQALKQREGKTGSWIAQRVQYAIMVLLVGITALAILYEVNSYNPAIDGLSFNSFLIGVLAVELTLLCASLLMHVWMIRNALEITEAFAFLKYRHDHAGIKRTISNYQHSDAAQLQRQFSADTQTFIREMNSLKRYHPKEAREVLQTIPLSILQEMEKVMGYKINSKK